MVSVTVTPAKHCGVEAANHHKEADKPISAPRKVYRERVRENTQDTWYISSTSGNSLIYQIYLDFGALVSSLSKYSIGYTSKSKS